MDLNDRLNEIESLLDRIANTLDPIKQVELVAVRKEIFDAIRDHETKINQLENTISLIEKRIGEN